MSEWIEKTLDEIGYFKSSGVDKIIKPDEKIVRLVNYMDVYQSVKIDNSFYLSETSATQHEIESFDLRKGDVLFTPTSETPDDIGHSSVVIEDLENAVYSYHLSRFREFAEKFLDDEFKAYLFNQYFVLHQFEKKAAGTTRFTLTRGSFESTVVKFPKDKNIQNKIAKILSTADAVIEKTQAAIAKYKAIKQGMLQDLFTRGIDPATNQLRPRCEDAPELYKESKLGMIPKEWEEKELKTLCYDKPTYGINAPAVEFNYSLPTYLRITDIDEDGNFSKQGRKSVDSIYSENYILKRGDLAFARTGATVGKTYLYNEADGILIYAGFLIKVSPNEKILNSNFLKFLTETNYYLNWIGFMSQRSAQPGINGNEYGSLLIAKPHIEEQTEIAERLLAINKKLKTEQTYLHKLQQIKKGLMEDLLSGRKRVKVSEPLINQIQ